MGACALTVDAVLRWSLVVCRYKEHQCRFIFRFSLLDIGALARAFGLLKLPKMPEFRELKVGVHAVCCHTAKALLTLRLPPLSGGV